MVWSNSFWPKAAAVAEARGEPEFTGDVADECPAVPEEGVSRINNVHACRKDQCTRGYLMRARSPCPFATTQARSEHGHGTTNTVLEEDSLASVSTTSDDPCGRGANRQRNGRSQSRLDACRKAKQEMRSALCQTKSDEFDSHASSSSSPSTCLGPHDFSAALELSFGSSGPKDGSGSGSRGNLNDSWESQRYRQEKNGLGPVSDATLQDVITQIPLGTDGQLSSVGSIGHEAGNCVPCVFSRTRSGCMSGVKCPFCHLPHKQSSTGSSSSKKKSQYKKVVNRLSLAAEVAHAVDNPALS